jgi:hypothetical protein
MNHIENFCGETNASGIRRIKLIDVNDVLSIKKPYFNKDNDSWYVPLSGFRLKPQAAIISIDFFSGLAGMTENMVESESGITFQSNVETSVKIDNPDCAISVSLLVDRGLIGLVEDRNGICKVLGDLKQPLRLVSTVVSIGGNERLLGFGCEMKHQAYFIETIREEYLFLGHTRAFSKGFSFGFK